MRLFLVTFFPVNWEKLIILQEQKWKGLRNGCTVAWFKRL